jgi:hypothetical protein
MLSIYDTPVPNIRILKALTPVAIQHGSLHFLLLTCRDAPLHAPFDTLLKLAVASLLPFHTLSDSSTPTEADQSREATLDVPS